MYNNNCGLLIKIIDDGVGIDMFKEILQYRELLYMLTLRDIKIRYKQSVMGFLWAFFLPMVIVASGFVVRAAFSLTSGKPLQYQSLAAMSVKSIHWSLFINSIRFATNSLIQNGRLIVHIYFPREILPLSSVLVNLFDFFIPLIVIMCVFAVTGVGISIYTLWFPVLLIMYIMLIVGAGLLLSCANLFFRDVKYIVEVALTFGIFFTPVFYDASMFGKWENILLLNPVGSILECISRVCLYHQSPNAFWFCYCALWSAGIFYIGLRVFHKAESFFSEIL
ncbi:ABC transporter permease [Candidatus Magnetomonas plexicatena]|uniref:ABC transporter permease n=1 Tax=Candidatus Magnetomonas plexicatena TaxID=2552947 RepID=UPI0011013590|nr:ABC transporter permease [Nitrospirales bacterium LBB_01]